MTGKNCLADLTPGSSAVVDKINIIGGIRRRLQDIGLIEGTDIECILKSPLGDPNAYLIRGAVIALRSEDSSEITLKNIKTIKNTKEKEKNMSKKKTNWFDSESYFEKNRGNREKKEKSKIIALAGNPNVGKSTVFNELTGMNQHTGNWSGKTVSNAQGYFTFENKDYILVDLPGCYSLAAHSAEEDVARDFICFGKPDAVVVVCDATCVERNFNLVLQILEITSKIVVCVNLMDEAENKNIDVKLSLLSKRLGVPVVGTSARRKKGLDVLLKSISEILDGNNDEKCKDILPILHKITYPEYIEKKISEIQSVISTKVNAENLRFLSIKILEYDTAFLTSAKKYLDFDIEQHHDIYEKIKETEEIRQQITDDIVTTIVVEAENMCNDIVTYKNKSCRQKDIKKDRLLTNKWLGFPCMILILLFIFWITISGANYPSELIGNFLFGIEKYIFRFLTWIKIPNFICELLVSGVYRVLAWVVSVMLPPMAIFFPFFTLLEDIGYLPRIAFNLDRCYKKCNACGKQALTMCMGVGCNSVGVMGCRIIDSPRERLIAILTNNFVPCNGRFPILISVISMFFISSTGGFAQSVLSSFLLTIVIIFGVMMTFIVSKFLSKTVLKGVPSSFTLELPPYRKPQIGKVILRSVFDRTLFVLARAVIVAAPAGLIIWIVANVNVNGISVLASCAAFLDPFGKLLGMDGVIILAFILGLPANEIVIPIIIMAYMANGNMVSIDNLSVLKSILTANGWTWITAVNVMLFTLMHSPCSTTCLTIKKETQSLKWTLVSILIPTVSGILICFIFNILAKLVLTMFIS